MQSELPRTGNDTLPLIITGLILFAIGALCVGVSREIKQAES